ncbi:polyphosphate polymerase domain-containing protein [Candidatus Saccharibacteria bacterium]|nr:polyphosphate polymerase domain-containing protein [Candidatus Saccharibacteria bacterium]
MKPIITTDDRTIERVEEKYLISRSEKSALLKNIRKYLEKDEYYKESVLSLYLDTKHSDLANRSIDRPPFREKIRVRAYNVPAESSPVFFEVKAKLAFRYQKIGNKRRLILPLKDFYRYLETGKNLEKTVKTFSKNDRQQLQVARELDYLMKYHALEPKVLISADRTAFVGKDNPAFRLTFDENLRFRTTNLRLEKGTKGEKFFKKSEPQNIIMEVKTLDAMPLWFVRELSAFKIYPDRFSKYGKIYQLITERKTHV